MSTFAQCDFTLANIQHVTFQTTTRFLLGVIANPPREISVYSSSGNANQVVFHRALPFLIWGTHTLMHDHGARAAIAPHHFLMNYHHFPWYIRTATKMNYMYMYIHCTCTTVEPVYYTVPRTSGFKEVNDRWRFNVMYICTKL